MHSVSFIVPVRNDAERLRRCLATIAAIDYPRDRTEVIVADNGSDDESPIVAERAGARLFICPDVRVSELRNRAAAIANGDVLVFVDADHEIGSDWLVTALDVLRTPDVGIAGALCVAPAEGTWVQRSYDALRNHTPTRGDVEWIGSGTMAVKRQVFADTAGFDTRLETCEDVDFCRRVRAAGFRVVSDPALATLHWGDPPTLRAVFLGELWRGRDNLTASLRGPITLRSIPSIAIPLIDLACLIASAAAIAGLIAPRALTGVVSMLTIVVLAVLRPARMALRHRRLDVIEFGQSLVIACTHDLARAVALIIRAPHRRAAPRQTPATARS